jgi:hypothetical protein
MKKTSKKLGLNLTTVVHLSEQGLGRVRGGIIADTQDTERACQTQDSLCTNSAFCG